MDVKRRKLRATAFFMITIGLLILASSILVHRTIREHLVGRGDRSSFSSFLPFFRDQKIEGVSAAVLFSEQTASYLSEVNSGEDVSSETIYNNYRQQALFWERYLESRNYQTTIINDRDLIRQLHNFNLLVLPFALCLSTEQIDSIKFFLEQGKGVILTHSSGNRDELGNERSEWSLTSDVLGGRPYFMQQNEENQITHYNLVSVTPLTVNIPPGWSTQVETYDQPMAMNLIEARSNEAAFWTTTHFSEEERKVERTRASAIAYGSYIRGRFIWMGFNPNMIIEETDTWLNFDRYLNNSVNWVTGKTVAGKSIWNSARAGATFAIIPQRDYIRTLTLLELFEKERIKPAVFIDYQQAEFHRLMIDQLIEKGEPAVQVTDVSTQDEYLRNEFHRRAIYVKTELEKRIQEKVFGFLSSSHQDLNIDGLSRAGYEYVWVNDVNGRYPVTVRTNYQSLLRRRRNTVLFMQSSRSDDEIINSIDDLTPTRFLEELKNDFNKIYRVGGLHTITLNSHLYSSELNQNAIAEFLRFVKARNVLIYSPKEMAKWWRKQDNINIQIQENPRRVVLMITNESRDHVEATTVYLYTALLPETLSIRAEKINVPIPNYSINTAESRIDLTIRNLNPNESRTYFINYR